MPTVILLDVSLSMTRPVAVPDCTEEYQRRHLAIHGVNALLDYCSIHTKLEFVSLVSCHLCLSGLALCLVCLNIPV